MDRSQAHYAPVSSMSLNDVLRRVVSYIIEGAAISVACVLIPQRKMSVHEVIMIALTASAVFAILDMFSPKVSDATRFGVGLGTGLSLTGVSAGAFAPQLA